MAEPTVLAVGDIERAPEQTKLPEVPLWIGGKAVRAHGTRHRAITNPATGQVTRTVPFATAADVDAAVAAARAAWPAWRDTPALRRARFLMRFRELMLEHQEELAALVTAEHGKVHLDADGLGAARHRGHRVRRPRRRTCSRARTRPTCRHAAWTRTRGCSRSACAWASRRSTSR